jgi:hypothetical protein
MESKYYTPTIDEFFPGFEYEWNTKSISEQLRTRPEPTWEKTIFWKDEPYETATGIGFLFRNSEIRVKYLDKSDIEELGFTYQKHGTFYKTIGDKTFIRLQHTQPDKILIEITHEGYTSRTSLIIKNKSELKKLLKMLGV